MRLIITCLLISISITLNLAQEIKLHEDLIQDKDFPAFNRELLINIDGDTVSGYAFVASGEDQKPTVILAHGFPGFDNNFDLAQSLRRNNINVVHFYYRGSWGSEGTYMYSNCLEDVHRLVEYLSKEEQVEKFRIDPENLILLGRSYGGGVALIAGARSDKVKKIIGISSTNYGQVMANKVSLDELTSYSSYMQKQVAINTDITDFLQEMLDNKEAFQILNYKEKLINKKVLLIEDSDRNNAWISQLNNIDLVEMETDHGFIDKRLEMTALIISWINKN